MSDMASKRLATSWNEHLADFHPVTEDALGYRPRDAKAAALRVERASGSHAEFLARRGLLAPERVKADRELVGRIRSKNELKRRPSGAERAAANAEKAAQGKGPRFIAPLRQRVYERDGHRCVTCGTNRQLTLDHWVPRSKGGPHSFENLRTMCGPCNHAKGDSLPPDYVPVARSFSANHALARAAA